MVNVIGQRESERALQLGHLYSGEEALKVGLIDELVAPEEMEERVQKILGQWLKVPPKARGITKNILRQPVAQKLIDNKKQDIEGTDLNDLKNMTESLQECMKNYFGSNMQTHAFRTSDPFVNIFDLIDLKQILLESR